MNHPTLQFSGKHLRTAENDKMTSTIDFKRRQKNTTWEIALPDGQDLVGRRPKVVDT